jgi:hypothetical protein
MMAFSAKTRQKLKIIFLLVNATRFFDRKSITWYPLDSSMGLAVLAI